MTDLLVPSGTIVKQDLKNALEVVRTRRITCALKDRGLRKALYALFFILSSFSLLVTRV